MIHHRIAARNGRHRLVERKPQTDYDEPKWQGRSQRQIHEKQDALIWVLKWIVLPLIIVIVAARLLLG